LVDPDEPFKKWSEFLQNTPIIHSTNKLSVYIHFNFEGSPSNKLQVQLETLICDFFDLSQSHIHEEQEKRLFLEIQLRCDKFDRGEEKHRDCERAYRTMLEKILASQEKVYH
jgi:hypothetical protein